MVSRGALVLALVVGPAGCAARPHGAPPASRGGTAGSEITLYRDHAVVSQRVAVVIPPASTGTVRVRVAAGVRAEQVYIVDQGGLTVREAHTIGDPSGGLPPPIEGDSEDAPEDPDEVLTPAPDPEQPLAPTEIELVLGATHEGTFMFSVNYTTERISWDAAYTMTTTMARDRAVLRGAIAIRNATGIGFRDAELRILDAEQELATGHVAERMASRLAGKPPSITPAPIPRQLGRFDLVEGDSRIELLANTAPREMRSVLVYDPIGTKLDHGGAAPFRDTSFGVHPPARGLVTESFEVQRDVVATAGLPAGPVRLLERRADGSLAVLGEARLFDVATRVASVDTVPVGIAAGVTGKRERRELTDDDDARRLTEEFVITIDNKRPRPVEVVLREHLYRGQNWTLAYQSAPLAAKEGPQQISLRLVAPANGQSKVLYVVVYTW